MSTEIVTVSWNVQGNPDAWDRLAQIRDQSGAQFALIQEARPPRSWRCHPDSAAHGEWNITAHRDRKRRFASAAVILDPALTLMPVQPQGRADAK